MTKDEAINVLTKYTDTDGGISEVVAEAHRMGIETLKKESCEDAVRRKDALNIAGIASMSVQEVVKAIEDLPPVRPKTYAERPVKIGREENNDAER